MTNGQWETEEKSDPQNGISGPKRAEAVSKRLFRVNITSTRQIKYLKTSERSNWCWHEEKVSNTSANK